MLTLYHNDMFSCAQKVRFVLAEKIYIGIARSSTCAAAINSDQPI